MKKNKSSKISICFLNMWISNKSFSGVFVDLFVLVFLFILCFFLFPSGHLSGNQKAPEPWSGGGEWDVRGRLSRPPGPLQKWYWPCVRRRGDAAARSSMLARFCCAAVMGQQDQKSLSKLRCANWVWVPQRQTEYATRACGGPPSPSGTLHRRSLKRWSSEGTGRRLNSETSPHYIRHYSELTLTHPPMCYRLKTTSDPSSS